MRRLPPLLLVLALLGCADTDQAVYTAGAPGVATFYNPVQDPVFLAGCAPFVFERRLDGAWSETGPPFVCVWEGNAVVVEWRQSVDTPFDAPADSGLYRLNYEVGRNCKPDQPLSQAGCEFSGPVHSDSFEVERELCEPSDPGCRHAPAAPNVLCEDGVHVSGPASECTRDPSTGGCGYEFLRCP